MNANAREAALKAFREKPDTNVLLISIKCGSLGLNLTCANHVFLMDLWWNPFVGMPFFMFLKFQEHQAIDRVYRIGQKLPVTVTRLCIEDSVEDHILELQKRKMENANAVLADEERLQVGDLRKLFRMGSIRG